MCDGTRGFALARGKLVRMRCGVRSSAIAALRRWAERHTRPVVDGSGFQSRQIGDQQYWNSQYVVGSAADEWFIGAEEAAKSTIDVLVGAHLQDAINRQQRPLRVLNLGCGTSRLGDALANALTMQLGLDACVMNVDYSPAAIQTAGEASSHDRRQHHRVWDATAGTSPPALPAQPQPAYDLLVDKGTLDALLFAGQERLVSYCAALHECLLTRGGAAACDVSPLFVHFTDDESRGELLEAAFPGADSWRVDCSELELESDAAAGWSTFRFTVSHPADGR